MYIAKDYEPDIWDSAGNFATADQADSLRCKSKVQWAASVDNDTVRRGGSKCFQGLEGFSNESITRSASSCCSSSLRTLHQTELLKIRLNCQTVIGRPIQVWVVGSLTHLWFGSGPNSHIATAKKATNCSGDLETQVKRPHPWSQKLSWRYQR